MRNKLLLVLALLLSLGACTTSRLVKQEKRIYPKREFRGAWFQTIYQNDYRGLSADDFRALMDQRLDRLKRYGINAIFFQIRPEADAFYPSRYEPWSRWLTGRQGESPDDDAFDPLAYLIEACHLRGLEFHAWLNPYRAGATDFEDFAETHIYRRHPEWFVRYNRMTLFDPGIPDCRLFICGVVRDIVTRYNIDGIHIDDYFYPYPVAGEPFPDEESFSRYGPPAGFSANRRDDWRRNNINLLIRELKMTVASAKPWVSFGVSPFGIYRNKSSDRHGSDTRGLQDYDDLYADVVLWMKNGWIDYCAPQLYWEIGHKSADYSTLIRWWSGLKTRTPLYIGQDVARTMKAGQLAQKMIEEREAKRVDGHIFWPAGELLRNNGHVADSLRRIWHRYPALTPPLSKAYTDRPDAVQNLRIAQTDGATRLVWDIAPQDPRTPRKTPMRYVVYRFPLGERRDISRASMIVAITGEPSFQLRDSDLELPYTYVVTAVDRYHNESKPCKPLKLDGRTRYINLRGELGRRP